MDIFVKDGRLVKGIKTNEKSGMHKFLEDNMLLKEITIQFLNQNEDYLNGFTKFVVKTIKEQETGTGVRWFTFNNIANVYFDSSYSDENFLYLKNRGKDSIIIIKENGETWE